MLANKYSQNEQKELFIVTAEELGLSLPAVVEKDYYVTCLLALLSKIENEYFKLIFQGGTALSKAYQVIRRMSEDCDFRIIYKNPKDALNKGKQRKKLRGLRHQISEMLELNGFKLIQPVNIHAEGKLFSFKLEYPKIFKEESSIKPYLALDFCLDHLLDTPNVKNITTLVKLQLGNQINHPVLSFSCMSILESAAEKYVSLIRRVNTDLFKSKSDNDLIRHLYDLHEISRSPIFDTQKFSKIAVNVIKHDQDKFKNQGGIFIESSDSAIKLALEYLRSHTEWIRYWPIFINEMVYHQTNPITWEQSLTNLENLSQAILRLG
jgi:hypothetical protein